MYPGDIPAPSVTATLAHPATGAWSPAPVPARPLPSVGPRVRVELTGVGTVPQVRAVLTQAWRLQGQPIIVVLTPHWGPTERAAADWAAEHAVVGIGLEVRHTTEAAYPHRIVVDAAVALQWCGCVAPPCGRCLDEPAPCSGCGSPLCEDCRGPLGGTP